MSLLCHDTIPKRGKRWCVVSNQESEKSMIAAGADAAKVTPQEEIFFWLVIIIAIAIVAHAIYRIINRP